MDFPLDGWSQHNSENEMISFICSKWGSNQAPFLSGGFSQRNGVFPCLGICSICQYLDKESKKTIVNYKIAWCWEKCSLCWINEAGKLLLVSDISRKMDWI